MTPSLEERANVGLHPHVLAKVEALLPARDACILDVGCGSGALLHRLAARGYTKLVGLDIAPPQASAPGLRFIECDLDACTTPLADASVDLITSVEVFEHVENIGSLLRELSRVLAADGCIVATTPNVHSVEARLRYLMLGRLKQFDEIGDPTHILPIFMFTFDRVLRRHGFELAETWGFPEDGSSPTSRFGLRLASGVLRALGARSAPAGDQLCMVIRKAETTSPRDAATKRAALTSHY